MATTTIVESYHINVGLGDSAIHVLSQAAGNKQIAKSAVLIDGGLARDAATRNIAKTIENIEEFYSNLGPTKPLKFRSIVITHWDADHWRGINRLLQLELAEGGKFKNGRYSRFYYDGDGTNEFGTTVYAPTMWNGPKSQKNGEGITITGNNKECFFSFNGVKMANAMVGSSIIGCDFFTNEKPSKKEYSYIDTFEDLLGNKPTREVGMYCVASDLNVIGLVKRKRRTGLKLIDTLFNQLPTKTNQQSIAAIILWKNGHVSHYFAGDLDFWGEVLIAEWLENNLVANKTPYNLTCVKSSHHGARNSNPPKLYLVTKPKHVIFSSADHYGHPSWEALMMLYGFYTKEKMIGPGKVPPCIVTCYPYWLQAIHEAKGLDPNKINVDVFFKESAFKKLSAARQKHANHLRSLFKHQFASVADADNMELSIRASCLEHDSNDEEAIFEEIAIKFASIGTSLFLDLWKWDYAGQTTTEIIYVKLSLTDSIDEENSKVEYEWKYKPVNDGDQIETVYFSSEVDGDGDEDEPKPPINVKKPVESLSSDQIKFVHVFKESGEVVVLKKGDWGLLGKRALVEAEKKNKTPDRMTLRSHKKPEEQWGDDPEMENPFTMQSIQLPILGASVASSSARGLVSAEASVSAKATNSEPGRYAFSILSSSYEATVEARTDSLDYAVLGVNDWLDDFLLSMNPSAMRLKSSPEEGWALLHEDDYLGNWIRKGLGGSQMAINGQGPALRIETAQGLIFNTEATPKALATDAIVSSDGLSPWTRNGTMIFGLDSSASHPIVSSWSIGEILSLFPTDPNANVDPLTRTMAIVNDGLLGVRWALDLATSDGKRNAIWVTPIVSYRTILRLAFVPEKDSTAALCGFLGHFFPSGDKNDEPVFDVSDVQLILRKTCTLRAKKGRDTEMVTVQSLTLTAVMTLLGPKPDDPDETRAKVSPTVSIELASTGTLELTIKTSNSEDSFTSVVGGWLSKLFPMGNNSMLDTLRDQDISKNIWFRRLTIALSPDKSISKASLALEVNAKLGQGDNPAKNLPILFEAEYTNTPGGNSQWSISGNLWLQSKVKIPLSLYSDYEEFRSLKPVTPDPVPVLELTTLFSSMAGGSKIPDLPQGIPNAITAAGFRVDKESLFVSGTITDCRHIVSESSAPALTFKELTMEASWNWKQGKVQVDLYFWLSLTLPSWYDAPEGCAASALTGSVSYGSDGKWSVSAEVLDLNLGMLYGFFPESVQDTLFELLKGIRIVNLGVSYSSEGTGQGTKLLCEGRLMLGDVVSLGLSYTCHANGKWKFYASLGSDEEIIEPVTLGQIMNSLVDSSDTNLSSSLPDFLADTVILGGEDTSPKLEFTVEKDEKTNSPKLTVTASVMGFEVEFVQMKHIPPAGGSSGKEEEPASEKKAPKVLRLFKAVLTKIPMPQSVPILDHLDQPFDELGFFWINQAVTKEQLAALDGKLDMPSPPPTEGSGEASGEKKDAAIAMTGGFHFVIIAKNKVVLDYPLGKSDSDDKKKKLGDEDDEPKAPDGGAVKPSEPQPPTRGDEKPSQSSNSPYKKTAGGLSISQIGFRYEGDTLAILMDATIAFGPVALDLIAFTLGLRFKSADGSVKNLKSLSWEDVDVSISGVAVKYDKAPLTIAGAFLHEKSGDNDLYAGGLQVGFTPWLFQAAGFYGVIGKQGDPNSFKCLFAYAMLRGPIMNIAGFAEISGLTGAFGYNVDLTLPTMSNISKFPLLSPADEGVEPKDLVRTLIPGDGHRGDFFNPLDGAMFVAAGLTVTAFQMLEMTAVIALQWSPRVQLALLGLAKCDVPSIKSPVKFAHIELGILATVDLEASIMKVEAQLSPNSWIIHKNCHLTGGFALYYWFGAGQTDWVMTIGGYHAAFAVPAHYPRPDRLRISWALNSSLSVSGEAYFAITPKVCMGGLRIRAALSVGALYAWFDAAADFLMNYAPFHFTAEVKVSVGVRFSMNVWFVTVHIAIEVAARLALMGPPLQGIVHVDFWVFGFDIAFGDKDGHALPEAASSAKFWDLVTQAEGKSGAGTKDAHLFSCTKGLVVENKKDIKASDPWLVRSGVFSFTIECQYAIKSVTVNDGKAKLPEGIAIDEIHAKPMRLSNAIDSTLSVLISGAGNFKSVGWQAKAAWKDVPKALWGPYKESEDPSAARPGSDFSKLLNSGDGMARLLMGVVIEAPVAKVSLDEMPAYRVDKAMKQNIYKPDEEPQFLPNEEESPDFAPLPRDSAVSGWDALKAAWKGSPAPQSAVDKWQEIFNTTGLVGTKPTDLITHNKVLFLSAPLLGKV